TECRDAGIHRLAVVALVDRRHFVVLLAGVEFIGQFGHPITELAGHGMPPLDFSSGLGAAHSKNPGQCQGQMTNTHANLVSLVYWIERPAGKAARKSEL